MYEIRKLSDDIINAIAAGEVIERPYSIVKELVENSLDAGAKNIDVFVAETQGFFIKVIDDGSGIDEKYLDLSLERHATSKLLNTNLSGVKTLGFRGEALYAIAAASSLTIISKTSSMKEAKKIIVKDKKKSILIPSKGRKGTEVTVKEIFKNIPVRRKFMKSTRAEYYSIRNTLKKIAFSHPKVSITYNEDGKLKYLFSVVKKEKQILNRINEVLGEEFIKSSLYFKVKKNFFSIEGFISIPTFTRPNWTDSIIVLNNRVITDRQILGVIKAAYAGLISSIRFPVVALFFNIKEDNLDFNVHPTKSEVRIIERKFINSVLIKTIRETFKDAGLHSSVSFEKNLISSFKHSANISKNIDIQFKFGTRNYPKGDKINNTKLVDTKESFRLGQALFQINKMFIISRTEEKLILIDQHAAHERIVLERIRSGFLNRENIRQVLLIPEIIKIKENRELLFRNEKEINRLGFIFEDYGEDSVLIREIPTILGKINIQELMEDLLINIKNIGKIDAKNSNIERIFSSISCHNSIRSGRSLNIEEMNALLRLMEDTPNSGQCNHGRPTFIELSIKDIEKLFGRI